MQDIEKNAVRIGKLISCALRHKPEILNLVMDKEGWVSCDTLIANVAKRYGGFTKSDLDYIVENNNKKRYSYNDDKTKIRANQGHSINVDVSLERRHDRRRNREQRPYNKASGIRRED